MELETLKEGHTRTDHNGTPDPLATGFNLPLLIETMKQGFTRANGELSERK